MSKMPCGHEESCLSGFSPDFIGDNPRHMTIGTTYCMACEQAAKDKDSGYWQARYNVLYERCLNLLPQIERQHGTPESEDWCRLMWKLVAEPGPWNKA